MRPVRIDGFRRGFFLLKPARTGFIAVMVFLLSGCKTSPGGNVSLNKFREPLRKHLTDIACKGIVMPDDTFIKTLASDEDLRNMSRSEQSVLRATAYREMMRRKSFDHFNLLINHLDDSASILIDAGEFGVWQRRQSGSSAAVDREYRFGKAGHQVVEIDW